MPKWKKVKLEGVEGKPVPGYRRGDYLVYLNINHGLQGPGELDKQGHHWWFEVSCDIKGQEVTVGEAPTLDGAKAIATRHERNEA